MRLEAQVSREPEALRDQLETSVTLDLLDKLGSLDLEVLLVILD